MEFPRLVYRGPAKHQLVETDEQLSAALADGWFGSVPEAAAGLAAKAASVAAEAGPADDVRSPPTRPELEQMATELKIKFDGRTTDRKLAEAIDARLAL